MVEHERTGLLCPPGDWETLARNVIRVLQHQDLAQSLAMRAREAAMNYSWPRVRSKWLELYRSLPARDAKFANDHS